MYTRQNLNDSLREAHGDYSAPTAQCVLNYYYVTFTTEPLGEHQGIIMPHGNTSVLLTNSQNH